ncbi:MAG: ribonuclease [Betaproteobacteria bacterium]
MALLASASPLLPAFEGSTHHATMSTSQLPKEGRETLALIRKGGPFPYAKDGTIFSNRERMLPREPRGFYHEYTVKTPGARDRGARRIICGGKQQQACYYTADHYATFKLIQE